MRVLVAHNYYQQAGGEDGVFRDESALLEEYGDSVLTIERRNEEIESEGPIRRIGVAAGTIWNQTSYRESRRLMQEFRPAVMHVHNTLPLLSPSIYHAARAEGVAVVQTLHNYRILCAGALFFRDGRPCEDCLGKRVPLNGIRHKCYRGSTAASTAVTASTSIHRLFRTWTRTINRYIAMTEFGKSRFVAGGLPEGKIAVKPHFVRNAPERGTGGGGYFLFVGRLTYEKGVQVLLEAWSRQRSGLQLYVVGDGPESASVSRTAAGLEGVKVLGGLPPDRVLQLMRDATAVVVPSLWYETFGRVVTEAFACGTPVIVSDVGAIAELVEDGVTGFRFPPGDPDALAERLNRFGNSEIATTEMRDAAYGQYQLRYTPNVNYKLLLNVYRDAIEDASAQK
jgi:glycosyltransferase involved in cell wall biosynthesis